MPLAKTYLHHLSQQLGTSMVRTLLATVSWGLSLVAVKHSFQFALVAYLEFKQIDPYAQFRTVPTTVDDLILPFLMAGAWVFLAMMTITWIFNRRCYLAIPIIGTFIGLPCAAFGAALIVPIPFFISTVPLAVYLVFWHVEQSPIRNKRIHHD